ncbi:hypothetical protein U9M48_004815 [Paspalum notatum var. saurae]|uniref:F-box protein AT5G49610-like beta-propeller domain-containing protein n=1 Tax=Paspalum notatum var. saurae TaxID=547442 RepID=A0AAQ3PNQ9_PASNO
MVAPSPASCPRPSPACAAPTASRTGHQTRDGRVLLVDDDSYSSRWGAIERLEFPKPLLWYPGLLTFTATVLCASAAGDGSCDHLDCHHGPFAVVLVGTTLWTGATCSCVYSSAAGAWGEPVYGPHSDYVIGGRPRSALVGNALYFVFEGNKTILEYDLGPRAMSVIELPREQTQPFIKLFGPVELTTTVDGRLGFARVEKSRLCVWSMEEAGGARWALRQAIELEKVLPLPAKWTSKIFLAGSAEGVGVIFVTVEDQLFTVDLRRCGQATKIYEHLRLSNAMVVPYMSFFFPGNEPSQES